MSLCDRLLLSAVSPVLGADEPGVWPLPTLLHREYWPLPPLLRDAAACCSAGGLDGSIFISTSGRWALRYE